MLNLWRRKVKQRLSSSEKEFLPAVLEVVEKPPSPIGRATIWTIAVLIVITVLWAFIGEIDEVAVAPGKIIPAGYVKVIQAEDKGVVKNIHVREGQKVKQGDILVELDPTVSAADFERTKKELAYYNLEMERLIAEKGHIPFTPKSYTGGDPKDLDLQKQLHQSRMAEFHAKLSAAEFNVKQAQAALNTTIASRNKYQALYEIAREKEEKIVQLVEQNAIAHFVLLDHRARRMELEQNHNASEAEISRAEFALSQSWSNQQTLLAEWDREITAKLVEDRQRVQLLSEEIKKAEEKNRLSRLSAPIEGRIHQLAVHTLGGVVTAAQPLMVIVPENVTLEAETWIANKDIGFIRVGQSAEIKVETFNFQKFGTFPAEVVEISPDAVEDKDMGRVYRAVLKVSQDGIKTDSKQMILNPGMSVSAEIITKKKKVIDFFLDPFKKYQSEGLRER